MAPSSILNPPSSILRRKAHPARKKAAFHPEPFCAARELLDVSEKLRQLLDLQNQSGPDSTGPDRLKAISLAADLLSIGAEVTTPIPANVTAQQAIAVEARRRRDEARRLRAEADAGWQAAKRWFEEQLLGGAK